MSDVTGLVGSLSEGQKDAILIDLFICLSQGRLLDSATGWKLTNGRRGVRPQPMGCYQFSPHAPMWTSLNDWYPRSRFPLRGAADESSE